MSGPSLPHAGPLTLVAFGAAAFATWGLARWARRRRWGDRADAAVRAYLDIARAHNLDPAQMALSYVISRQFVTSAIMGSTNLAQMKLDIAASRVELSAEVLDAIEQTHKIYTYPCP